MVCNIIYEWKLEESNVNHDIFYATFYTLNTANEEHGFVYMSGKDFTLEYVLEFSFSSWITRHLIK